MEKAEMEEKYDKYIGMVYRTAFTYFGNKYDAEDIVSDVFIKYFTHKQVFDSEEHEKAWLMRVTVNRCKDILKSFRIKKSVPLEETNIISTDENNDDDLLCDAVMRLPKNYRLAIHLYYYEGYTTKEISQITGKSDQTIRTRLSRARKMLREKLGKELYA